MRGYRLRQRPVRAKQGRGRARARPRGEGLARHTGLLGPATLAKPVFRPASSRAHARAQTAPHTLSLLSLCSLSTCPPNRPARPFLRTPFAFAAQFFGEKGGKVPEGQLL